MNLLIKSLFGKKKPVRAPRKSVHKPNGFITRMTKEGDRIAFSWPVREALYRHLSSQHANGVTVEAALDTFRARLQRRKKFSSDKIVADVARRRRDGSTLAKALTTWIPQDEISVISSGEMSGKLSEALNLVIEAKRRIGRVNSALKTSMVTPTIYAVAVYGMLWGIGRFVTPGLQQALPIEKAHGLVYGLYVAGDLANSLWAVLPPIVLILIIALIVKSLQKWTGKNRVIAEQFFPYSFYRDIQGYTWLMSYSALLRAGMADVDILKRQAAQSSPWLKERLHSIGWRMDNGASFADALILKGKNGMPAFGFPNPDIVDDIGSLAGFSDFPAKVAVLAMQWADEIEISTLARAKTFGFVVEMFIFGIMGLLMVAINMMSTQMGGTSSGM